MPARPGFVVFPAIGLALFLAGLAAADLLAPRAALSRLAPGLAEGGADVRGDVLPGPVPARVLRVVDGDTVNVRAAVWVGQSVDVAVRLRGIDAPELRGGCEEERALAREARAWLEAAVSGERLVLTRIKGGKYFGRVIADVTNAHGRAVGPALLAAGLARRYDGGRREGWCVSAN